MHLTLGDIANCLECVPGRLIAPEGNGHSWREVNPTGAQIDSRLVRPGELFFCLCGQKVDGHDYALQAATAGAAAIIAERNPFSEADLALLQGPVPPVLLVPDVIEAMGILAILHRDTTSATVVGITGTAGKTSVKEVLAGVLSFRGSVAKNKMNLNNRIGLPLSMLQASPDDDFWVMEVGISEADDMYELGAILRPDAALILNVGSGHVLGLGERGVAYYKSRLLHYIAAHGIGVVNYDYPELVTYAKEWQSECSGGQKLVGFSGDWQGSSQGGQKLVSFSKKSDGCHYYAVYLGSSDDPIKGRYLVHYPGGTQEVAAPFKGSYGAENVAAIYAVAQTLGLTAGEIARGFVEAVLPEQRFTCYRHKGFFIVDDSYNSNPLSSKRMLETATLLAAEQNMPLILVMGEMFELGGETETAHCTLGEHMAQSGASIIFWKGEQRPFIRQGLAQAGYAGEIYPVGGGQEFSALLEELNLQTGLVLFKGSRSNYLERLVDVFLDAAGSE